MSSFIADKIVMDGLTFDDVLLIPAYSEVLPKTVGLKTRFSRQFAEMEKDSSNTDEQIMAFGSGSLRKAVVDGNIEEGSFMAGQIAGMIRENQSAAAIVNKMVSEAEGLLGNINNRLQ